MKKFVLAVALLGFAVSAWRVDHLLHARRPHAIVLTWTNPAPTANNAAAGTEIFRGVAPGQEDPTPIAIVPLPSRDNIPMGIGTYSDFLGLPGTTYYYVALQMNKIGTSLKSNETSAVFKGDPPWYQRRDPTLIAALCVLLVSVLVLLFGDSSTSGKRALVPTIRK
jgi:hypothetical protein